MSFTLIHSQKKKVCRGFTLVEMMVVLSIIVIILATAVPVFNALTGTHSLAAGQNQVASALATARADAIYYRQVMGIFFFVDPNTGQVALAEVQADPQTSGGTTYTPAFVSPANTPYATFNNGPVNALELVNVYTEPDTTLAPPQTTGSFAYFRDIVLLPANIGVALNNNYYNFSYDSANAADTPFDRYTRLGASLVDATG
jgi:prepilin-type N-terminal cleavage/methylation domain-containing protein